MDNMIQLATVLAAFAAVHERLVEFLQGLSQSSSPVVRWVGTLGGLISWNEASSIAWKSALLAVALAFGTHASLLDLMHVVRRGDETTTLFALHYMQFGSVPDVPPWVWYEPGTAVGCLLMGLSTALGSKFWHDVTSGLTDLRDKGKAVGDAASPSHPRPPQVPPALLGAHRAG